MPPQIRPEEAVQDFLTERKGEVSFSTHRNYQYPLKTLVEFCEVRGIEYVNDLDGYQLKKWKLMRKESGIKKMTLRNNISTMRVFLEWCEESELVEPGLHDRLSLPDMNENEEVSDATISEKRVKNTLGYLEKFEYGMLRHAMFQFIWHTCVRMGTLQAIDVDDYYPKRQFVEIRHRPETGTPLKNKAKAERQINLSKETCDVLDDYISTHRKPMDDDAHREPLFTTSHGRISKTTIRKNMYALTRPCHVTNECPHKKEISKCEATDFKLASRCPSSMSPHPLRRAALTYHIERNWPKDKLSERGNVSVDVLNKHYDESREEKNRMNRQEYLDNL